MDECFVCGINASKYKCPRCHIRYCNLTCWKTHQENPCVEVKEEPKRVHRPNKPQGQSLDKKDRYTCSVQLLQRLDDDKDIQSCVDNPKLQKLIKHILQHSDPLAEVKNIQTGNADFAAFADQCLKCIGARNSEGELNNSSLHVGIIFMANQAAKKLKQSNQQFLLILLSSITFVNVLVLIFNFPSIMWWDTFQWWNWALWGISFFVSLACLYVLYASSRCTYDDTGKLINAGEDLKGGGLLGYIFDICCVILFVQLLSCIHNWAWFVIIVIPIFAAVKLWGLFFGGSSGAAAPAPPTNKNRGGGRKRA